MNPFHSDVSMHIGRICGELSILHFLIKFSMVRVSI